MNIFSVIVWHRYFFSSFSARNSPQKNPYVDNFAVDNKTLDRKIHQNRSKLGKSKILELVNDGHHLPYFLYQIFPGFVSQICRTLFRYRRLVLCDIIRMFIIYSIHTVSIFVSSHIFFIFRLKKLAVLWKTFMITWTNFLSRQQNSN